MESLEIVESRRYFPNNYSVTKVKAYSGSLLESCSDLRPFAAAP